MKSFKLFNEAEREAGYKMPAHVATAQKKFDAQSKQKKPAQAGTLAAQRNMKKEEVEDDKIPMYLRKLLRGVTVNVDGKEMPINLMKVMRGIDFFERTKKLQSMPKDVLVHYQAFLDRQQTVAKAFATRAAQVKEDKGTPKHHQFQKTFKQAMYHAKTHQDLDTDGDVDSLEKLIPDEITGDEKNQKMLQKKVAQKHDLELKHTRKGVAFESVEHLEELTNMKSYKMAYLLKLIKDGEWEAYSDVKQGKHVTLTRLKDKKKVTVMVEEVELNEISAAHAARILGGPVKKKPTPTPGKHPMGYRMARSAARRAMKGAPGYHDAASQKREEVKEKQVKDMSTGALKQFWNRHKDEVRPAPVFAAKLRQVAQELKRRQALKKESVNLEESHFKVGDEVACMRSGKTGVVTKIDPSGKGAYYTVKRADGSVMKFAPDEIKKVTKEAKKPSAAMKARRDAMRGIRGDKDLAFKGDDDDVKASDDDVKAASKNPVMQLRRISDLDGKGDMEFKNGKKGKVTSAEAKALLKVFDTLRMPKEKEDFQNAIGKSLDDLKKVLKSPPKPKAPFKQKIKGSRYMSSFKWDNED